MFYFFSLTLLIGFNLALAQSDLIVDPRSISPDDFSNYLVQGLDIPDISAPQARRILYPTPSQDQVTKVIDLFRKTYKIDHGNAFELYAKYYLEQKPTPPEYVHWASRLAVYLSSRPDLVEQIYFLNSDRQFQLVRSFFDSDLNPYGVESPFSNPFIKPTTLPFHEFFAPILHHPIDHKLYPARFRALTRWSTDLFNENPKKRSYHEIISLWVNAFAHGSPLVNKNKHDLEQQQNVADRYLAFFEWIRQEDPDHEVKHLKRVIKSLYGQHLPSGFKAFLDAELKNAKARNPSWISRLLHSCDRWLVGTPKP